MPLTARRGTAGGMFFLLSSLEREDGETKKNYLNILAIVCYNEKQHKCANSQYHQESQGVKQCVAMLSGQSNLNRF
jgi:hypothetical protein